METVELKITIDKEAIEAIFTLLKALSERESTKEKDNTITVSMTQSNTNKAANTNIDATNTYKTASTASNNNINNINNNNINAAADENTINTVNSNSVNSDNRYDTEVPTLEDVKKYVEACNYKMSAQKFYDYYRNNNWKTRKGVSLIGKWKGFVDTWAKSEFAPNSAATMATAETVPGMGSIEERRKAHPFVPSF